LPVCTGSFLLWVVFRPLLRSLSSWDREGGLQSLNITVQSSAIAWSKKEWVEMVSGRLGVEGGTLEQDRAGSHPSRGPCSATSLLGS
jgi:hypothetical protein